MKHEQCAGERRHRRQRVGRVRDQRACGSPGRRAASALGLGRYRVERTRARYEIANALAKQAAAGNLRNEAIDEAWEILDDLPIIYHPLSNGLSVVRATLDLQRRSAYDAAYLALAKDLGADLWTLDGPLAHNSSARGHRIHLIEPHPAEESERP